MEFLVTIAVVLAVLKIFDIIAVSWWIVSIPIAVPSIVALLLVKSMRMGNDADNDS